MTPSKSPSKRKSEGDISGRLCCDAGATDFNGSRVRSVRTSVFGQELTLRHRDAERKFEEIYHLEARIRETFRFIMWRTKNS
jgi:hypothetical protein